MSLKFLLLLIPGWGAFFCLLIPYCCFSSHTSEKESQQQYTFPLLCKLLQKEST